MRVITRSGEEEEVSFDKIKERLKELSNDLFSGKVDYIRVTQDTISRMHDKITTEELDNLSADICASQMINHPDFNKFAARICVSNLHKSTPVDILEVARQEYQTKDSKGNHSPLISKKLYEIVKKHHNKIQQKLDFNRDYNFDYFGIKTLERAYLMRKKKDITNQTSNDNLSSVKAGKIIERPQHMWMRVALGIHGEDLDSAFETYDLMSQMYFTHATPTLYNSGTPFPQLSSCFLLGMHDSIDGIFKTISDGAQISKRAGGIGIHISAVRASGSRIRGTNGRSDGIVPMCKVINQMALYVNQGGRRKGSVAVYIEPWHADIEDFCELRKPVGAEEMRARDLFLALWVPDLFMKRVQEGGDWSLMCPDQCPGLVSSYGDEFEKLYIKYEEEGKYIKKIKATSLWIKIMESQIESGLPYIAFKDSVNRKTNQNNIGMIRSSNLCCEIMEYSDENEYAVCNLASLGLPRFVEYNVKDKVKIYTKTNCGYCKRAKVFLSYRNIKFEEICLDNDDERKDFYSNINSDLGLTGSNSINSVPQIFFGDRRIGGFDSLVKNLKPKYNFEKLLKVSKIVTKNLNKIIDVNYYPVIETELSNKKHRPIGLGVQGLADVFNIMEVSFGSDEGRELNKKIFETIYYGCLQASNEIAMEREAQMKIFLELLDGKTIPEMYNKDLTILAEDEDNEINKELIKFYHELKPIRKELERETHLGSYSTFIGSNFSKGLFQYNLWGLKDEDLLMDFDWDTLRQNVIKYGTRNSLLTALMPTASTSQILGNNECFEPYTSNLYLRSTLAGEYIIINKNLILKLAELGLWNEEMKEEIMYFNGSIQNIHGIPDKIKEVFMTAYDMPQKNIVQQAVERGPFVDQSQSMNIFNNQPDFGKLASSHFYGWKNGLKTGMYYLRSQPAVDAIKFGLDSSSVKRIKNKYNSANNDLIEIDSDSESPNNSLIVKKHNRTYEVCDVCSG